MTPSAGAFADAVGALQEADAGAARRASRAHRATRRSPRVAAGACRRPPGRRGTVMLEDGLAGVFSMATAPDMRGRGVASALLARLLSWAWEHGAAHAYLQVDATEPIRRSRCTGKFGFATAYTYHYCGRQGGVPLTEDTLTLARELGRALEREAGACARPRNPAPAGSSQAPSPISRGSSGWFERGFVTYTNEAKVELLGVPDATLAEHGAVSEAAARAMAEGALARSRAARRCGRHRHCRPDGGSPAKPVGHGLLRLGRAGRPTTVRDPHAFPGAGRRPRGLGGRRAGGPARPARPFGLGRIAGLASNDRSMPYFAPACRTTVRWPETR